MRVVAHFKDAAGAPHVAESLFKTAQILEKLKDDKTASETYQQVAAQYPDSPVAAQAKESAERLKKARKSNNREATRTIFPPCINSSDATRSGCSPSVRLA
jgi:hypothetical protein